MINRRIAWSLFLVVLLAGAARAQTPPQLIFTTDYNDAAIYIDGSLACRKQCAIEQGTPGARYSVTCKLQGYLDGTASGLFPAEGSIVVKCPLKPRLDDVAQLHPAAGGAPPPESAVALTPAILDAVMVSSPGLQRCFLDAEGRGETHAGKLWVQFWVTPDGSAGNARFDTEGYDGTEIHGCVVEQLAQLRFPPYSGSEGKRIKFPIVPGRLRQAGAEALDAGAGLAPAIIDATIESNEAISACLESARKRGRLGREELWLHFTVAPSGAASGASVESTRRVHATLETCVTEQANRLWFPSSSPSDQLVKARLGAE